MPLHLPETGEDRGPRAGAVEPTQQRSEKQMSDMQKPAHWTVGAKKDGWTVARVREFFAVVKSDDKPAKWAVELINGKRLTAESSTDAGEKGRKFRDEQKAKGVKVERKAPAKKSAAKAPAKKTAKAPAKKQSAAAKKSSRQPAKKTTAAKAPARKTSRAKVSSKK